MASFDELFIQLPLFQTAICREHRSAVTAKSAASHVNSQHRHLAVSIRKRIAEKASALRDDSLLAADIHGIRFPDQVIPAIECLPVWSDGKKCMQCRHIRRTREDIQKHCRSVHGWTNPRRRGGKPGARPAGGLGETWVDGVHCQRFGQTGALQQLFEVMPPAGGVQSRSGSESRSGGEGGEEEGSRIQATIRAEFEASAQAIKKKDEAAAALIGDQSRLSANMWVRRTGWPRHLRQFNREWLVATMRRPDPEKEVEEEDKDNDNKADDKARSKARSKTRSEAALAIALLAVERVIWRAQKASRAEVVGSAAVNYIERREAGGESNEKPFNAGQKGVTMVKYTEAWKSVMAYIWRTGHLEVGGVKGEQGEGEAREGGRDRDGDGDGGGDRDREDSEGAGDSQDQEAEAAIRNKRPAYHFTTQQAKKFKQVHTTAYTITSDHNDSNRGSASPGPSSSPGLGSSPGKDNTSELEGHVLDFFIALLDHDIGDNEYQNALYSGLAVLGIQAEHGWRSALVYTPVLSAIVTVARMFVLYKAKRAREDEIRRRQNATYESEAEARQRARSHFDRVGEMVRRFMTIIAYNGQPSPMDSILRLRAYGKAIRANTNADGVVDWHGDELLFGHVRFSMASLRAMIHGLLHSARAHLRRSVLLLDVDEDGEVAAGAGATALPAIRWDRLVDNAAETKAGWSFVEDPRNEEAFGGIDGKTWLAGRVVGEARLQGEFFGVRGAGRAAGAWQMERVYEYAKAIKLFRAQLLVLMHISGGQPARGTELVTVQYKNGADGDIRGLFVEDGLVVFVTMYNKTIGMSAKAKVIHRYLPQEVGELAAYYVWLAIPFWRLVVQGSSQGTADWGSPYIWEPRADEAWPFPGTAGEGSGQGSGKGSRKRERVAARNVAKKRGAQLPPRSGSEVSRAEEQQEQEQERPRDKQTGSDMWSQPDPWDTNRISRQISKVSLQHMGERLSIISWRHSVKAIYRRYIKNKAIMDIIDNADTAEGEDEEQDRAGKAVGDPFHAQSGHGARIGEGIYGRSMDESLFSTEARRIGFRRVSREWHAFCMFDSVLQESSSSRTRPSQLDDIARQATEEENRRWKKMRQVDIRTQLRKMLGPSAQFRGVQEEALGAIIRQESPVVVVMGTGGGKSMLFMLPAACGAAAGGLTVVVVPLVSLRSDIKDRCDQSGIECVEWSGGRPHEWASVVLVTPEAAVGESFGHFVNRQRAMGRLDRIVVDECHVVLDSGAGGGWRSRVLGLRGLVKAEAQMVYLTATLRPADEAEFGRLVGLPAAGGVEGQGARWFRSATTRGNVRYQVRRYDGREEKEEDVVARLVEEKKAQYGEEGGKIVVYCDTVGKTEQYARRLGGLCYHRKVGTAEEKRAIVRQLREGGQQVFTATNALGLGVDAPRIRVVIHVGIVRRLRDYAQESGRAGRGGQASEAIIVRAVRHDRRGRPIEETAEQAESRGVERAMWVFTETKGCVRVVLDGEMDGREDRTGCEEGEEACYRCEERIRVEGQEQEEVEEEVQEEVQEESDRGVDIRQAFDGISKEGKGAVSEGGRDSRDSEVNVEVEIDQGRAQRRMRGWEERRRQAEEIAEVEEFKEMLQAWSVGCTWCRANGEPDDAYSRHRLDGCEETKVDGVREMVERVRQAVRWERYSCCFDCGLPQEICAQYETRGPAGGFRRVVGRVCQYKGLLMQMVVSMWGAAGDAGSQWVYEWIREQGGQVGGDDFDGWFRWMGRKVRWGEVESNEMCRVVVRLRRFTAALL